MVIIVSLVASIVQLLFLVMSARLIGAQQYAAFSLIVAIALFFSAIFSEWLRMILARQAGSLRLRMRSHLLREIRQMMVLIVLTISFLGCLICSGAYAIGYFAVAANICAITILAASNVISDMTATFLRFTAESKTFYFFSLGRVLVTGAATIIAAAVSKNGLTSAYAFATANLVFSAVISIHKWSPGGERVPFKLLRRFFKAGAAMSTSFVSMAWVTAIFRSVIVACLSPDLSGLLLIAFDLGQRGYTVLGGAITTWGVRFIYDSAHKRDRQSAASIPRTVTHICTFLWFSLATYGTVAAVAAPLLVSNFIVHPWYVECASLMLVSLMIILGRVYIFDSLLSSISREKEIALASALLAGFSTLVCACAIAVRESWMAAAFGPIVAAFSLYVFWRRNASMIRECISSDAQNYVAIRLVIVLSLIGIVSIFGLTLEACMALLLLIALDCRELLRLRGLIRRTFTKF